MMCSIVRTCSRLFGQNLTKSYVTNRCILPSSFHLLYLNGNPSTAYQQCRTKKTYKENKLNRPLNFDYSGDTKPLEELKSNELLFKYRDIPEIQQLPEHLKKIFTAEYATAKEKLEHRHMLSQDSMSKELGPSHNLEKQITYLTVKIRNLIPKTIQMRANKCQKAHLVERIAKRNKFLGYLRQLDFNRYEWIQHELGITYTPHDKYAYIGTGKKTKRKKEARVDAIGEVRRHMEKCEKQFAEEMKKVQKEKEAILSEIKEYDLDSGKLAETFRKDMQEKLAPKPKLSPKFREFEEERKRKKLEEAYVV